MGDRILSVNGQDIREATHETAVMALLSKTDQMKLRIQHDPLPSGFQVGEMLTDCVHCARLPFFCTKSIAWREQLEEFPL